MRKIHKRQVLINQNNLRLNIGRPGSSAHSNRWEEVGESRRRAAGIKHRYPRMIDRTRRSCEREWRPIRGIWEWAAPLLMKCICFFSKRFSRIKLSTLRNRFFPTSLCEPQSSQRQYVFHQKKESLAPPLRLRKVRRCPFDFA